MPAHVIYGDSFLVAERLRQVKVEAGAADLMDSNRHVVSAGQARPDEVLAMCNSLPFLDTMRLVEIEGVLATQQGSARGRGSGRRSASASGAWAQLADAVPDLPDTTVLIFVDGDVQQNNPLLRSLSEHCAVHREATPNAQALLQWIKQKAEDKGSSITPPAMQVLAELVGGDLWTIDRELEKTVPLRYGSQYHRFRRAGHGALRSGGQHLRGRRFHHGWPAGTGSTVQ